MNAPAFVYDADVPLAGAYTDADLDPICKVDGCSCGLLARTGDYVCRAGHVQRVGRPPANLADELRDVAARKALRWRR